MKKMTTSEKGLIVGLSLMFFAYQALTSSSMTIAIVKTVSILTFSGLLCHLKIVVQKKTHRVSLLDYKFQFMILAAIIYLITTLI